MPCRVLLGPVATLRQVSPVLVLLDTLSLITIELAYINMIPCIKSTWIFGNLLLSCYLLAKNELQNMNVDSFLQSTKVED